MLAKPECKVWIQLNWWFLLLGKMVTVYSRLYSGLWRLHVKLESAICKSGQSKEVFSSSFDVVYCCDNLEFRSLTIAVGKG